MDQPRREFQVRLPIGYTDGSGGTHRDVVLRKMRGYEEALLCDASLAGSRLVTELLCSCLIRLGRIEPVTAAIVASLYTADRNYLLLQLRRITLGDRLHAIYRCPRCNEDVVAIENLGQLEVCWLNDDEPPADIEVRLEDGYEDRDGVLHADVVLTLPHGTDEEFVGPLARADPLKARDVLILRCIKRFGSIPKAALEAYGIKILRDLTLCDRQSIYRSFSEHMPGVNFQRTVQCRCGARFGAVLDVTDFFAAGRVEENA
jgi:hypothetical protein